MTTQNKTGSMGRLQADGLLVLTTLIWGSTFLVVQNSIKLVGPFAFVGLRFGLGALAVALLFSRNLRQLTKRELWTGGIIGTFLFGGYVCQTLGLEYTTTSKAGFITGLNVVIVPILGVFVLRQWPSFGATVGVVMATVGMALLSMGDNFDLQYGQGEFLVTVCAICFACQVIAVSAFAPGQNAYNLAIVQLATTSILSFLVVPFTNEEISPNIISQILLPLLFMGLIATGFTFAVMNRVQQFTSSTHAALIYALEPAFAGIFGYIAGESLSLAAWLGCGLIFSGMIFSELKFGPKKKHLDPEKVTA